MNKRVDWGIILYDCLFKIFQSVLILSDTIASYLSSISVWIVLCNAEGHIKWIEKQV